MISTDQSVVELAARAIPGCEHYRLYGTSTWILVRPVQAIEAVNDKCAVYMPIQSAEHRSVIKVRLQGHWSDVFFTAVPDTPVPFNLHSNYISGLTTVFVEVLP